MRIKQKYNMLRLLMIISLILLAGFSGYWLKSQYLDEKVLLQEELQRTFKVAGNEVLDSLLLDVYIRPALHDSVNFTITLDGDVRAGKHDSLWIEKDLDHILVEKGIPRDSGIPGKVFVHRDSIQTGGAKRIEVIHAATDSSITDNDFIWKDEDMLVRSFKLVMSKASDNSVTDSIRLIRFDGKENTTILRDLFRKKMEEGGFHFQIDWVHWDSIELTTVPHGKLLVSDQGLFTRDAAVISGVIPYVLQQLFPQILFVLVLLGVTCTAFFLMYRTLKKQYELNMMRQDLVSNMTHELKTPVSTMKVALEALNVFSVSDDPVKAKEYTDIASQEINRLDALIARMLDLTAMESSDKLRSIESIDLISLVEECLLALKPLIMDQGALVEIRKPEGDTIVKGDPEALESAFQNILDNSLKYSGASPEIIIRVSGSESNISLIVDDNGPGIDTKYSKKIFEKFFRVPTGDVHNVKGHGLGLSFAAQVMHQHGGRIIQKNRPEGGSRFIMEFRRFKNGNDGI